MVVSGYVGFFDEIDLSEDDLKDPLRLKSLLELRDELRKSRIQYLKILAELKGFSLIRPSLMRELTPKGKEISNQFFSRARDSLNGLDITVNSDYLLGMVQHISLSVYLPRGEPCRYCEMDIFVYEMADQLWRTYFDSPDAKSLVGRISEKEHLFPHHIPYLGGIEVMAQCIEKGTLEVNPHEIRPLEGCALKFVLPSYSELIGDSDVRNVH
jgi:hypothetical protein